MPDESIVVTPLRSSRMFVRPPLMALVMTSRNCWSPEPMVIFPSSLMISTPSTLRELAFMSLLLPPRRQLSMFAGCGDPRALGEVLRHDQGRPAAGGERISNLVHERLHVKDSSATCFHEVFWAEGIADFLRVEACALVGDVDRQVQTSQVERGAHLLADVELVPVFDRVRHRLAHSHADPVGAVLVEARVLTQVLRDHLNQLDVLESAADGDLDPLAVTVLHRWKPGAFYGTPARPATAEWGA